MSKGELLLRVEHVKFRSPGVSRSPVGTFTVYDDRVEWTDNASSDKLVIPFSDIRGQRVSPPNKTKTQLQLCLQNDEQPTFSFVNPEGDKEARVKERDLVKETLQQSLIRHRQITNQAAARSLKFSKSHELEEKKKILENNKHLQQLYRHLVASKLISAQDFWGEYYHSKEGDDDDKVGVSGGFLSSIAQSEGANGVKLNLNVDTIQSIFKTYPAVEKKHLELVPHEMTEQQFWSKFFQSHYFYRERTSAPNPADPFSDCVKADDAEMNKMMASEVSKKTLDFSYLNDDINLASGSELPPPPPGSSASNRTLLVRRCNYHSGRVLLTARENAAADKLGESVNGAAENSAEPKEDEEEHIVIESEELRSEDDGVRTEQIALSESNVTYTVPSEYDPERYSRLSELVAELASEPSVSSRLTQDDETMSMFDAEDFICAGEPAANEEMSIGGSALIELQELYDSLAELLKHFWMCFPLTTPEMEEKLGRMESTLRNFENGKLAEAETRFGKRNVAHAHYMLGLAYSKYEAMAQRRKK